MLLDAVTNSPGKENFTDLDFWKGWMSTIKETKIAGQSTSPTAIIYMISQFIFFYTLLSPYLFFLHDFFLISLFLLG